MNANFPVFWSRQWESKPLSILGNLLYCLCTTPALGFFLFLVSGDSHNWNRSEVADLESRLRRWTGFNRLENM